MRCEGLSIQFLEINIQNIRVVYPKTEHFQLNKTVTRVRAVIVTLYVHENLTFKLTKYERVNIRKTLRLKTNGKIKFMVGNINKAKMKMLAESDWVLIKILIGRRKEKKK